MRARRERVNIIHKKDIIIMVGIRKSFRSISTLFLFVCTLFFVGCGDKGDSGTKGSDQGGDPFADEGPSTDELKKQEEEAERHAKAKEEAKIRFDKAIAQEPKFDLDAATKKLALEKLKVSLDEISRDKTKEEVERLIKAKAVEETNLTYSAAKRQVIVKEAEKEFPLFKENDEVKVITRRGPVTGILERVYNDKIKLGKFYILKNDIITPDPACFNKEQCEKRRNHYIRINFDIERNDHIKSIEKKITVKTYKENGFLSKGKKLIKIDDIIKSKFGPEIKKLEEEYNQQVKEKVRAEVEASLKKDGLLD